MEEILHQLRLVVYPIIYRVLYVPGGSGFTPSTILHVQIEKYQLESKLLFICINLTNLRVQQRSPHLA